MNMPTDRQAWRLLRDYAADQLPANFADNVLNAAYAPPPARPSMGRVFNQSAALSFCTVAVCVLAAVLIHAQMNRTANLRHLADWQEISRQVASIDPGP